jgi:hypothetical protein
VALDFFVSAALDLLRLFLSVALAVEPIRGVEMQSINTKTNLVDV